MKGVRTHILDDRFSIKRARKASGLFFDDAGYNFADCQNATDAKIILYFVPDYTADADELDPMTLAVSQDAVNSNRRRKQRDDAIDAENAHSAAVALKRDANVKRVFASIGYDVPTACSKSERRGIPTHVFWSLASMAIGHSCDGGGGSAATPLPVLFFDWDRTVSMWTGLPAATRTSRRRRDPYRGGKDAVRGFLDEIAPMKRGSKSIERVMCAIFGGEARLCAFLHMLYAYEHACTTHRTSASRARVYIVTAQDDSPHIQHVLDHLEHCAYEYLCKSTPRSSGKAVFDISKAGARAMISNIRVFADEQRRRHVSSTTLDDVKTKCEFMREVIDTDIARLVNETR